MDAPAEADADAPKGVEQTAKGPDAEAREESAEEVKEDGADPCLQPLQYLYDSVVDSMCCPAAGLEEVKITGYVDQTYTHNFNRPRDRVNSLRVFDRKDRAYLLNMAQLHVLKDPTEASRWGFGARLAAGWDADVTSSYWEDNTDKSDVIELYGSYLFPIGNGLTVKAGKFATLAGAEVIEQKDSFNISRSYMFGYGLPYTHTGVRAQYKINDMYDVTVGVLRGWDNFRHDPNDDVTYETRLGVSCSDKLSLAAVLLYGPEAAHDDAERGLIDLVATYKFSDKLTGVVETAFAQEENAVNSGSAKWGGVAGYLKYDCTERLSFAARSEYFRDGDGARTGVQQTLIGNTLTAQYKFQENLWGRLEYRNDWSNEDVFTRSDGFSGSQNTVAASVLYTF